MNDPDTGKSSFSYGGKEVAPVIRAIPGTQTRIDYVNRLYGVFEFREAPDRPREKAVQNHDLPFAFEDRERRLNSLGSLELKGRCPES